MYQNMSKEDIAKRLSILKDSISDAQSKATEAEQKQLEEINNAMEQLKAEYDADNEYVEFEEVKQEENEGHTEDICTLHSRESEADTQGLTPGVQE